MDFDDNMSGIRSIQKRDLILEFNIPSGKSANSSHGQVEKVLMEQAVVEAWKRPGWAYIAERSPDCAKRTIPLYRNRTEYHKKNEEGIWWYTDRFTMELKIGRVRRPKVSTIYKEMPQIPWFRLFCSLLSEAFEYEILLPTLEREKCAAMEKVSHLGWRSTEACDATILRRRLYPSTKLNCWWKFRSGDHIPCRRKGFVKLQGDAVSKGT